MSASTVTNLLIGLAVLAFILVRQMQVRPVRANMRLPLVLAIIGVIELTQFFQHGQHHATPAVLAALIGSLVLAGLLGGLRALTVRVWFNGGQALRQGTWLTVLLWLVSLGVHLGYDYLIIGKGSNSGLGTASLTLYFAITYTIQRLVLTARAQQIQSAPGADVTGPDVSDPGTRSRPW